MSVSRTLRLSGDCGLRGIRVLRDEVSVALNSAAILEIDCTAADCIDLSFVQLVTSAARTAEGEGKQIRITNLPEAGHAAFARAGLSVPGPIA